MARGDVTLPPPGERCLLYVDRDADRSAAVCTELLRCGLVFPFHDLGDLLEQLDAFPPSAFLLLDTATLIESPTGFIARLVDLRARRRIGLVTDQSLEQFLPSLRRWGLTQCLGKDSLSQPEEVEHFLAMLAEPLSGFGLVRYLTRTVQLYSVSAQDLQSKTTAIERVINHFATCGFDVHELYDVRLILEEITNNAFFHAFQTASGEEKYGVRRFQRLEQGESVRIEYGNDSVYVGFSVTDSAGTLRVPTILSKLERQFNRDGLFDQSGRGLYLSRMLASNLVINIEEGKRTQVVALFNERHRSQKPKPFLINWVGHDDFEEWREDPDFD